MYKINDYVKHKRQLCIVKAIKEKYYKDRDYYELAPINDVSLKIVVPIDNPNLKDIMTKEEAEILIDKIPNIPLITSDSKLIENEYKLLIATDSYEDLIRIIKTTYLRNQNRLNHHKKIGDKDNYYFEKAEEYLYGEMAVALNMSIPEVKDYIRGRVGNIA